MESLNPVNGEEMCIYISCFCKGTLSSGDSLFFLPLRGSFVNKAKSGGTGGGKSREDEVGRKGKTRREEKVIRQAQVCSWIKPDRS